MQVPVGHQGVAAVAADDAGEVGEAPAGLLDDHLGGGEVPGVGPGVHGDVDQALGDQAVVPEVAERRGSPSTPASGRASGPGARWCASRSRSVVDGVGVGEVADARHRDAARPPPRGRGRWCGRRRRRRPTSAGRARARSPRRRWGGRPRRGRSASPTPARRGRSSWCRRSGRAPTRGRAPSSPPRSSPSTASSGRWSAITDRRRSSHAMSASVTGVRSGLRSTRRSAARKRGSVTASAVSARARARARSSECPARPVGGGSWRAIVPADADHRSTVAT